MGVDLLLASRIGGLLEEGLIKAGGLKEIWCSIMGRIPLRIKDSPPSCSLIRRGNIRGWEPKRNMVSPSGLRLSIMGRNMVLNYPPQEGILEAGSLKEIWCSIMGRIPLRIKTPPPSCSLIRRGNIRGWEPKRNMVLTYGAHPPQD